MEGWIKLHRSLKVNDVFRDREALQVWIYILLEASHSYSKKIVKRKLEVDLYPGQCVFGRNQWAKDLNLSGQRIYRLIKWFEEKEMISVFPTYHYSIITIQNWSVYQNRNSEHQLDQQSEQQNEQPSNSNSNTLNVIDEQQNDNQMISQRTHPKNVKNDKNNKDIYSRVIDYLNNTAGKSYKPNTKATKQVINARINEGFTEDDFRTVIDIKTGQWLNDSKMSVYLRPSTLFGTKFESYLNEKSIKRQVRKQDEEPWMVDFIPEGDD